MPTGAALLGAQFSHQMLVVELAASSAITLLAGSNALAATVGVY